jgi:hypothetical protein
MANTSRPNGFSFAKSLTGHAPNAMLRRLEAADRSADATGNHGDIYIGDPVKLVAGKVLPANSGDTVYGVAVGTGTSTGITHGDAGNFHPESLETRYLALDADGYVWVMPAEGNLFEVSTAADLDLVEGSTADINLAAATAHGTRASGRSTVRLVASSNVDVLVVEQLNTPDNDVTLVDARHLVMFIDVTNAQA